MAAPSHQILPRWFPQSELSPARLEAAADALKRMSRQLKEHTRRTLAPPAPSKGGKPAAAHKALGSVLSVIESLTDRMEESVGLLTESGAASPSAGLERAAAEEAGAAVRRGSRARSLSPARASLAASSPSHKRRAAARKLSAGELEAREPPPRVRSYSQLTASRGIQLEKARHLRTLERVESASSPAAASSPPHEDFISQIKLKLRTNKERQRSHSSPSKLDDDSGSAAVCAGLEWAIERGELSRPVAAEISISRARLARLAVRHFEARRRAEIYAINALMRAQEMRRFARWAARKRMDLIVSSVRQSGSLDEAARSGLHALVEREMREMVAEELACVEAGVQVEDGGEEEREEAQLLLEGEAMGEEGEGAAEREEVQLLLAGEGTSEEGEVERGEVQVLLEGEAMAAEADEGEQRLARQLLEGADAAVSEAASLAECCGEEGAPTDVPSPPPTPPIDGERKESEAEGEGEGEEPNEEAAAGVAEERAGGGGEGSDVPPPRLPAAEAARAFLREASLGRAAAAAAATPHPLAEPDAAADEASLRRRQRRRRKRARAPRRSGSRSVSPAAATPAAAAAATPAAAAAAAATPATSPAATTPAAAAAPPPQPRAQPLGALLPAYLQSHAAAPLTARPHAGAARHASPFCKTARPALGEASICVRLRVAKATVSVPSPRAAPPHADESGRRGRAAEASRGARLAAPRARAGAAAWERWGGAAEAARSPRAAGGGARPYWQVECPRGAAAMVAPRLVKPPQRAGRPAAAPSVSAGGK
ncbi:hypothetical protein AB1Y20_007898 [Prymnesium parvum]|uniref:Uncharacterized protein n=1 Tax=Prymnesium parvum TaxID=97485 RepID=A0AB34IV19_PRYPA